MQENKSVSVRKRERLISFYKDEKFADCIFNIGGIEIKAHKLILACSSPVFEKMFFGDFSSSAIEICDISVEDFKNVLEFIYTERICISCVQNAWSLYHVADKYILDDLADVCVSYIKKNLTMKNLILNYEFAEMYNILDIKDTCFKDIVRYFSAAITGDYHMKPNTLSAVLDQVYNFYNTFDVALSLINWGIEECEMNDICLNPENVVSVLQKAHVTRYMKRDWIVYDACGSCNLPLIKCKCCDELVQRTTLDLEDKLKSNEESSIITPFIPNICKYRKEYKMACRSDLFDNDEFVSHITVNRPTMLLGVLVATPMSSGRISEKSYYEGSITIRISRSQSDIIIAKPTTVKGTIFYEAEKYLPLRDIPVLECNVCYELRISYSNHHLSGITEVHCHYMSNKLLNESSGCEVWFHEMFGTLVKGLSFYAA